MARNTASPHIAAPSFVMPGTVGENACFLSGRVAEVGLCLFEAQACLNYGPDDLPPVLADLPLSWHAHLPVDLPWEAGGAAAAFLALAVLDKVTYLSPRFAVLHPPGVAHGDAAQQAALLARFAVAWRQRSRIPVLLENIGGCPLTDMLEVFEGGDFGVCLDVGHLLGYGQNRLRETPQVMERVRLVHWSAPGDGDQHLPLSFLAPSQRTTACQTAAALPADVTHLVEVFHWGGVEASLPVLNALLCAI